MTLLEIRDVSKSFGPVSVLHGVDMSVDRGEVVGLVGDNGAGKSTLMKIVTGMYTADQGALTLDGEDILTHSP
ncbi:MAG: ATP-binding cassette domain-containing protein, partial [Maritimibacter sp.]|nr:ATP-binding cassette domain-containing protein [Maritimibacter sp.]